jgi:hypothetical protein
MMNKILPLLLVLCLLCVTVAGCSDKSDAQSENYIMAKPSPATSESAGTESAAPLLENDRTTEQGASAQAGDADVDLTALSSTMVYAEVYNMMTSPDDYIGKTIKMSGPYYASYYEETEQYYHYVVIEDATACCQQGLEFVWSGEHSYPADYPDDNTRVEVTGVFDSYEELGTTYYHLVVDDIVEL